MKFLFVGLVIVKLHNSVQKEPSILAYLSG